MSLQNIIDDPKKKALWVGGKGGVGKTSTASALALALAESGRNTLLISGCVRVIWIHVIF